MSPLYEPSFCIQFNTGTGDVNFNYDPQLKGGYVDYGLLTFDLDWLKKNKKSTFYVKNLETNTLWIEWPAWKNQPGVDKEVSEQNMKDLHGVEVTIRAYGNGNESTVAKTAYYGKGHKQYWKHKFRFT
ncbi:MAG: hypothetical protein CMM15_05050 [Rhodospirillaceae bacterium]|nr:hypothetical protein [Rhodospirillaceae bacterium]